MEDDLRLSKKNIDYLKQSILNIDEGTKEGLSNVTKEIGNKIIQAYDNAGELINQQRCENLKLQLEIANLIKEKNTLRHEVKNMVNAVKRLETLLGVEVDPRFDSMVNHTIFN
jgi:hypothetical protein